MQGSCARDPLKECPGQTSKREGRQDRAGECRSSKTANPGRTPPRELWFDATGGLRSVGLTPQSRSQQCFTCHWFKSALWGHTFPSTFRLLNPRASVSPRESCRRELLEVETDQSQGHTKMGPEWIWAEHQRHSSLPFIEHPV